MCKLVYILLTNATFLCLSTFILIMIQGHLMLLSYQLQIFMVLISVSWYLMFQSVSDLETFEDFGPC